LTVSRQPFQLTTMTAIVGKIVLMEPSPVQDNRGLQDNPLPDRKDGGRGRAKESKHRIASCGACSTPTNLPLASRRLTLPYFPIETVRETPHSLSYFPDQRVSESEDARRVE
jgi:hypothetical protein